MAVPRVTARDFFSPFRHIATQSTNQISNQTRHHINKSSYKKVSPVFSQFHLHERLLKAVTELNFLEPTSVQVAAIPPAMEGRDIRAIAQTGSGKTASFLLPVLDRLMDDVRPGTRIRVLILLPTRELAQQTLQQVEAFARFTFLKAQLITGGEDFKVQAAGLRKIPDVLIGTPGRLIEHLDSNTLPLDDIEVLVLDEADRMLDMGFAEDVERLATACTQRRQTLMYSATQGAAALRKLMDQLLTEPVNLKLNTIDEMGDSTRHQVITSDHDAHKDAQVRWLLENETYSKAIIFTNTRVHADRLYGHLVAEGYKAAVLHGEKDHKIRKQTMERFRQGGGKVLVATDLAARGLDIEGLDLVINFDMPRSGSEYVHRVGRTGRAGDEGLAISLISHNDWNLMCSIERYLKQHFERRNVPGMKAKYQGPKPGSAGKKKKIQKKLQKKGGGVKGSQKAKPAAKRGSASAAPANGSPARGGPTKAIKGTASGAGSTESSRDGFAPIRKKTNKPS